MTDSDDNNKDNLRIIRRPSQYSNRRHSRMVNRRLDWSHVKSKLKEMGITFYYFGLMFDHFILHCFMFLLSLLHVKNYDLSKILSHKSGICSKFSGATFLKLDTFQ